MQTDQAITFLDLGFELPAVTQCDCGPESEVDADFFFCWFWLPLLVLIARHGDVIATWCTQKSRIRKIESLDLLGSVDADPAGNSLNTKSLTFELVRDSVLFQFETVTLGPEAETADLVAFGLFRNQGSAVADKPCNNGLAYLRSEEAKLGRDLVSVFVLVDHILALGVVAVELVAGSRPGKYRVRQPLTLDEDHLQRLGLSDTELVALDLERAHVTDLRFPLGLRRRERSCGLCILLRSRPCIHSSNELHYYQYCVY